jgi:cell division protein YceG involved in septum cleavage
MKKTSKKGVMGPIISVFILVLIVSILAGLTFLFVSQLKTQTANTAAVTVTVTSQTGGFINATLYTLNADSLASNFAVTSAINATGGTINGGNWTLTSATGKLNVSATGTSQTNVNFSYTYTSPSGTTAYQAVNDTEAAGATVVDYLPLIFLAIIFGALLTLVLKIILPYINLGQSVGGF